MGYFKGPFGQHYSKSLRGVYTEGAPSWLARRLQCKWERTPQLGTLNKSSDCIIMYCWGGGWELAGQQLLGRKFPGGEGLGRAWKRPIVMICRRGSGRAVNRGDTHLPWFQGGPCLKYPKLRLWGFHRYVWGRDLTKLGSGWRRL